MTLSSQKTHLSGLTTPSQARKLTYLAWRASEPPLSSQKTHFAGLATFSKPENSLSWLEILGGSSATLKVWSGGFTRFQSSVQRVPSNSKYSALGCLGGAWVFKVQPKSVLPDRCATPGCAAISMSHSRVCAAALGWRRGVQGCVCASLKPEN